MNIFGRPLREHVRLLLPFFLLIAAVWTLRLTLGYADVPVWLARRFSVIDASVFSVLMVTLLIHLKRFGSYPNVVVAAFLLVFWAHLLIVLRIAIFSLTGWEFFASLRPSPRPDVAPLTHIIGHLAGGVGFTSIIGSAVGCLLLFLLRIFVPLNDRERPPI